MRILVICQYYSPEPFRHSDIFEELVRRGHEVTVITGLPNYPMGEIYDGYNNGEKRDETINGVKVHRCFTLGRKTGSLHRFLNYYSYVISSCCYVNKIKEKFDIVLVYQLSPVMMSEAAVRFKKKNRIPMILYCLDLWPASLAAGGIMPDSPVFKIFHKISKKIYRQADKILVTSKSFSDYFSKEFGIHNIEYLPQYSENLFSPEQCHKDKNENIDLMFAGNIGVAQSVDTIIAAAELTQDISNLRWHIVGDGSELENIKKLAKKLNNIYFYGRKKIEDMPAVYSMADAMIVTMQKNDSLNMTLPGKVQTYMAAGKPIIGAIDGETDKIIREAECGYCGMSENPKELAENVRLFIKNDNKILLGQNARNYYDEHFQKNMFIDKLESEMEKQVMRL